MERETKKVEEEIDLRPNTKFKPVGKIDLDSLNKRSFVPKQEETVEESVVEEVEVEKPVVRKVIRTRYVRNPVEYALLGSILFLMGLVIGILI